MSCVHELSKKALKKYEKHANKMAKEYSKSFDDVFILTITECCDISPQDAKVAVKALRKNQAGKIPDEVYDVLLSAGIIQFDEVEGHTHFSRITVYAALKNRNAM